MDKIYLVVEELNLSGNITINIIPCINKEIAWEEAEKLIEQERLKLIEEVGREEDVEEGEDVQGENKCYYASDSVQLNDSYLDIHIEVKDIVK